MYILCILWSAHITIPACTVQHWKHIEDRLPFPFAHRNFLLACARNGRTKSGSRSTWIPRQASRQNIPFQSVYCKASASRHHWKVPLIEFLTETAEKCSDARQIKWKMPLVGPSSSFEATSIAIKRPRYSFDNHQNPHRRGGGKEMHKFGCS